MRYAVYGGSAVRKPGTLAIAYYGSEIGHEGPFHGYIAETTNALDQSPVFSSARVNDPAVPLMPEQFDVGYARLFNGGELHEIVKPAYAPNGDVWASFARDMCFGLGMETIAAAGISPLTATRTTKARSGGWFTTELARCARRRQPFGRNTRYVLPNCDRDDHPRSK